MDYFSIFRVLKVGDNFVINGVNYRKMRLRYRQDVGMTNCINMDTGVFTYMPDGVRVETEGYEEERVGTEANREWLRSLP